MTKRISWQSLNKICVKLLEVQMVKYMYTHVHIYPCLIFLCKINVVIKIRKNELLFRWTINLALKTAENMFYADTPFDSEDLVEVIHLILYRHLFRNYLFKSLGLFEILPEIFLHFILNLAGWCYGSVFIFLFFLHDGLQIPPMQSSCQQICKLYHIFYVC